MNNFEKCETIELRSIKENQFALTVCGNVFLRKDGVLFHNIRRYSSDGCARRAAKNFLNG